MMDYQEEARRIVLARVANFDGPVDPKLVQLVIDSEANEMARQASAQEVSLDIDSPPVSGVRLLLP